MPEISKSTSPYIAPTLAVLAMVFLCGMDAVAKHLVATNHAVMVSLGRYVMGLPFVLLVWIGTGAPRITREIWQAHWLRGVMIAGASFFFFFALSQLPFVEVVIIGFLAPLIVPFIAHWMLQERIRGRSLVAVIFGFVGVFISVWRNDPDQVLDADANWGIASAIASAICYAVSVVLMRARAAVDGAALMGLMGTLVPAVLLVFPSVLLAPAPKVADLPAFLFLGLLATAGIVFLSKAYAMAEAQTLIVFDYTAIIWAALLGYLLFREVPGVQVWLGALVVTVACIWGNDPRQPAGSKPGKTSKHKHVGCDS